MNEKRRPPSLHRGLAPTQESPDPHRVTFAFTMTNREVVTHTARRADLDTMTDQINEAITLRKTVTLHDPNGERIIVNTAHVILVSVR